MSSALDKKIVDYLELLNNQQKKAVLGVIKTFAEPQENEYTPEFKKELDDRYVEYKKGGKLVSEAEANKRIRKIISGKSKK